MFSTPGLIKRLPQKKNYLGACISHLTFSKLVIPFYQEHSKKSMAISICIDKVSLMAKLTIKLMDKSQTKSLINQKLWPANPNSGS